ncbi:hypothetical protein HHI36_004002, partial [Cryptolaemus montrouzieri]
TPSPPAEGQKRQISDRDCNVFSLCNTLVLRNVEPDEDVGIIGSLKDTKSAGMDGVPVAALKFVAESCVW